MGGAQAVAALAYGTQSVPKVDKIVGPGNIFVATAKKLLYGTVDIDMIAGPSEILIVADKSANPKFLAADLMSQAEHDKMASAILLTTSEETANETAKELSRQMQTLERRDIIEQSLNDFGAIIVCKDISEAVDFANELAPEHLELAVETRWSISAEWITQAAFFSVIILPSRSAIILPVPTMFCLQAAPRGSFLRCRLTAS